MEKLLSERKEGQQSDHLDFEKKIFSPSEEIDSIYTLFQNNGSISDSELIKLRNTEKILLNGTSTKTPNATWDTLARLYDLTKNYNDLLRLGKQIILRDLGNNEATLRFLRVTSECEGVSEAYSATFELPKEKFSQLKVQELLSKFEYDLGKYHDAINRIKSLLEEHNDLSSARGILVVSLVETGDLDEACRVVMDAPATAINFPWAIMKLLSTLSKQEKYVDKIASITGKFLNSRGADREKWEMEILRTVGDLDQAKHLIRALLQKQPQDKQLNIELEKVNFAKTEWLEGKDHLDLVVQKNISIATPESDLVADKAEEKLEQLEYVGHLDLVTLEGISGWIINQSQPSKQILLDVWLDGEYIQTLKTSMERPDVTKGHTRANRPGFYFKVPKRWQIKTSWELKLTLTESGLPVLNTPKHVIAPYSILKALQEIQKLPFNTKDLLLYQQEIHWLQRNCFAPLIDKLRLDLNFSESILLNIDSEDKKERVDIIIPVYEGYEETVGCLESILNAKTKNTKVFTRIILINDTSPNKALVSYIEKLQLQPEFNIIVGSWWIPRA